MNSICQTLNFTSSLTLTLILPSSHFTYELLAYINSIFELTFPKDYELVKAFKVMHYELNPSNATTIVQVSVPRLP